MKKRIKNRVKQAKRIAVMLPLVGVVTAAMMAATLLGDYAGESPLDRL